MPGGGRVTGRQRVVLRFGSWHPLNLTKRPWHRDTPRLHMALNQEAGIQRRATLLQYSAQLGRCRICCSNMVALTIAHIDNPEGPLVFITHSLLDGATGQHQQEPKSMRSGASSVIASRCAEYFIRGCKSMATRSTQFCYNLRSKPSLISLLQTCSR
jgi:hypothetical protein